MQLCDFELQGAIDGEIQTDPSSTVSETITRANTDIHVSVCSSAATWLIHGDIVPKLTRNADPCTATGCKWPKQGPYVTVPITISSTYNTEERNIIIGGLLSFHQSTCIRFVWKNQTHQDYLHFFSGTGQVLVLCGPSEPEQPISLRADVREQPISLRRNGCLYRSTVQHEVLHALGFHHEQVRSDRDKYVSILTGNIQPGMEGNFEKVKTNNLETTYDFNSVMHYSNKAFSKNGNPTIIARSNPNLTFGFATEMSANDIARVNKLYQCCE
ncbi:hypothetical protein L3Q82_008519 [Scortum barcoo]|uniref:Uncharacterized protein n=1 Tax=Scortum barcoo TaxID=214431 RepID=A0ACB8XCN1_9TELE|nr:hypothetical protein L3Q82_008519 [Scortum barcoo]